MQPQVNASLQKKMYTQEREGKEMGAGGRTYIISICVDHFCSQMVHWKDPKH